MAEILNLRQARKRREREAKDEQAAANRAAFGRSRAERTATKAEEERRSRGFDAHRREAGDAPGRGEDS